MNPFPRRVLVALAALSLLASGAGRAVAADQEQAAVPLPPGVRAVWDLGRAFREQAATRERVCLNGLWRWQPGQDLAAAVPTSRWGYFKVPGFWPGLTSYIQEDCQTLHVHPAWKNTDIRGLTTAWYQREITVPASWTGRRISLAVEYLHSFAVVYLDGTKVGELRFPAGEVDLTAACRPGSTHVLSLLVVALPLQSVLRSYSDTNAVREVRGSVERRGLCGDVYLTSTPPAARITDVKVDPSVRKGELTVHTALEGLEAGRAYTLRLTFGEVGGTPRTVTSAPFRATDLTAGRIRVTERWRPERLWDLRTPQHRCEVQVALVAEAGQAVDVFYPVRFGFREFWIDGRDFYLNGTRLYLSAVPLDNAQVGARTATFAGARETLRRMQSFGINFVYTHNYGCQPGAHVSFEQVLRAADDLGMLVALSQPHFGHYDWKAADAGQANGYARHAAFYVRVAQNHPSVVAYSMSHNATGYAEDMNPDRIDGRHDPRAGDRWSQNNAALALRAEALVQALDPGRIVYHHSSGNLGSMHTVNFYLNFVPIQELSDWFEHWATQGVKPVFPCEYGVPFSWDWAMYRGWYKGERAFGSARVPWEFCLAEWNAQFLGDRAFQITEMEKRNLRWEARQFRAGNVWHRWDYPHALGSSDFDDRQEVFAQYLTDNWRAHRTWGISANSPWEYALFWKPRAGLERHRQELPVAWDALQRPGFSPDYVPVRPGQMTLDLAAPDWVPTAAAQALLRNNQPLLAYIAGKPDRFTSKDHNVLPGETIEKQLIVLNNSRAPVWCDCSWKLALPQPLAGSTQVAVPTGTQTRIPLRLELPSTLPPGTYRLDATVQFRSQEAATPSPGETQQDSFTLHVLPRPARPEVEARVALFDPRGETSKLLADLGVPFAPVTATADLSGYDVLILGKEALTTTGPGPDVRRVRDGLKVLVFEQSAEVLEQRFGFRVAEYGLRQVFPRVPDHPVLAGLQVEHLRDWRGSATLLPPRLQYTMRPRHGPTVRWCGIEVSRAWRCGCQGNVASVLLEKPARGDFLPLVDGGYSLQYSPLLEYREGKGLVLFCQLDVTGRTEADPAARTLTSNLLRHVAAWRPTPRRPVVYAGEAAGQGHLEAAGLAPQLYAPGQLAPECVLIVGPGGGKQLAGDAAAVRAWLQAGGRLLALGLEGTEASAFLPAPVATRRQEHIATHFAAPGVASLLAGIGPADVHNRDPRELPLVTSGAAVLGNGVLARAEQGSVVLCQLVPWQFDARKPMNLKRTFRRAACLVSRLAANLGAASSTPLLARFHSPVEAARPEQRWLEGLYLDVPEEWDDPYRFFRW